MTLVMLLVMLILLCFGAWRAGLIVLGAGVLIDVLILLLRVGARATLEEGEFSLTVIAGPVRLKLLPKPPELYTEKKKPEKPKKPKKPKEPKEKEPQEAEEKKSKLNISMELIRIVLSAVGEALGRLRRRISIDKLTIHYTVVSDDPFNTAMTYAYACAAVNALMPVLENSFRIKERDVGAAVDFTVTEPQIYVDAQLTIAVWEIIYIVLAGLPVVKVLLAGRKSGKVAENGQASDQ